MLCVFFTCCSGARLGRKRRLRNVVCSVYIKRDDLIVAEAYTLNRDLAAQPAHAQEVLHRTLGVAVSEIYSSRCVPFRG